MAAAQFTSPTTAILLHEVKPIQGKLFGFVTHSYDQGIQKPLFTV